MPIFIFTKESFWKRPSERKTERLKIIVIRTYTEIHREAQRYTETNTIVTLQALYALHKL